MMKLKVGELVNSIGALQKLSEINLKAKAAWQVVRFLTQADAEYTSYNKARMALLQKYADKDEDGNLVTENGTYKLSDVNLTAFNEELTELLLSEIELNVDKIKFADIEDANFTPNELGQLTPFIEFEE